jgi:Coenzyme PQQ synthesis protein D (PqqD)
MGTAAPPPLDTVVVPRLDVIVRRVDGVLHVGRGEQAYELSESAATLWRAIDGHRTIADLAAILAEEYGIDAQTAAVDVHELLADLADSGILALRAPVQS